MRFRDQSRRGRRTEIKGLNINDSTKKYQLQKWSGGYTGLQVISIMYAAFQQFAPGTDLGIDLSREYRIATQPNE